eukprot:scaffold10565_cov129-Isochrysis_galbana.AAC.2
MLPGDIGKGSPVEQRVSGGELLLGGGGESDVVVEQVAPQLERRPKVGLVVCDVGPVNELIQLGLVMWTLSLGAGTDASQQHPQILAHEVEPAVAQIRLAVVWDDQPHLIARLDPLEPRLAARHSRAPAGLGRLERLALRLGTQPFSLGRRQHAGDKQRRRTRAERARLGLLVQPLPGRAQQVLRLDHVADTRPVMGRAGGWGRRERSPLNHEARRLVGFVAPVAERTAVGDGADAEQRLELGRVVLASVGQGRSSRRVTIEETEGCQRGETAARESAERVSSYSAKTSSANGLRKASRSTGRHASREYEAGSGVGREVGATPRSASASAEASATDGGRRDAACAAAAGGAGASPVTSEADESVARSGACRGVLGAGRFRPVRSAVLADEGGGRKSGWSSGWFSSS